MGQFLGKYIVLGKSDFLDHESILATKNLQKGQTVFQTFLDTIIDGFSKVVLLTIAVLNQRGISCDICKMGFFFYIQGRQ